MTRPIDFIAINAEALRALPVILPRWLPGGKRQGREFVAKNPTRADRTPGSFRINVVTGKWSDFATGDRGATRLALAAFLFGLSQTKAARFVAAMFGISEDPHDHRR